MTGHPTLSYLVVTYYSPLTFNLVRDYTYYSKSRVLLFNRLFPASIILLLKCFTTRRKLVIFNLFCVTYHVQVVYLSFSTQTIDLRIHKVT